jgi:hypothetical protein
MTLWEQGVRYPVHDILHVRTERLNSGDTEMNRKSLAVLIISLLATGASAAIACEYKSGETKFVDYAHCRYGENSIEIINLPEGSNWEQCIYYVEAFRPEKLLAVTRTKDGRELASINNRSQIGNPCYMNKKHCDAALRASKQ